MILPALAIPLLVLLAFFVCLALQQTLSNWLRIVLNNVWAFQPTKTKSSTVKKVLTGSLFLGPLVAVALGAGKVVNWPIERVVTSVENTVSSALSHYAGGQLTAVTKWFNSLAALTEDMAVAIGDGTAATWDALRILRETTIPALVNTAVAPIRTIALRADKVAAQTADQIADITVDLGTALRVAGLGAWVTLHNQLIGMAHALDDLHEEVWGKIRPDVAALKTQVYSALAAQIAAIHTTIDVAIPGQIDALRDRVRGVEAAIAGLLDQAPPLPGDITGIPGNILDRLKALADPLIFAGAAVAAITAFAPQLFCRNTLRAAEKVCAADDDLLEGLLSGLALVVGVISIEELVREAQAAAGTVFNALDGLE